MKTSKVLHAPRELSSKLSMTFDEEARAELVRENIDTFETVVEIPFGDYTPDDLYRWTQNIDESWTKQFGFDGRYRSSSVGDVVVIDGNAFMVASFGFSQLDNLKGI